jgi:hypothetical protein
MAHLHPSDEQRDSWIDDGLRGLTAAETLRPDVSRARARLERRAISAAAHRRQLMAGTIVAAIVLVALPGPRTLAAQLWNRLVLGRVVVVDVPRANLPESVTDVFAMTPTSSDNSCCYDRATVERLAGFRLLLPTAGVRGAPGFMAIERLTYSTKPLHVDEIQRALRAGGVTDVQIPRAWEGTTLVAEGGPVIVAVYQDPITKREIQVMQAAPFHMTTSSSLQFGEFMTLAFRVFGQPPAKARELGARLQVNPGLVMHFPKRGTTVVDVPLRSGVGGVLVDEGESDGACFFWSTADRIFALSADTMTASEASAIADSMR